MRHFPSGEFEHRAAHYFANRHHRGEIWYAYWDSQGRTRFTMNKDTPGLLGEAEYRNGAFHIVPLQQRSPEELARLHEQAMAHRRYRAELYKRYSLAERLADLNGKNLVKVKQDKPN